MQFIIRYTDPTGKWVVEEFGTDYWRASRRQVALAKERLEKLKQGWDPSKVIGYPYLEIGGGTDDRTS